MGSFFWRREKQRAVLYECDQLCEVKNRVTLLNCHINVFPYVCGRRTHICCCLDVVLQENIFFFYIKLMEFRMIMEHFEHLCVCLGWIFFFSLVSTPCFRSVKVFVTGQENVTKHTWVCRHKHGWRRSNFPWKNIWFWRDVLKPVQRCDSSCVGSLVGFVITAHSLIQYDVTRSVWYKCQPWTYLWFRETLTANIISMWPGWYKTIRSQKSAPHVVIILIWLRWSPKRLECCISASW